MRHTWIELRNLEYSRETCGICGSNNTMVTDQSYTCFNCGYDDPYSW